MAVERKLVLLLLCLISTLMDIKEAMASQSARSNRCLQGLPGQPGHNGVPGHNGAPGRDGRDCAKGDNGPRGTKGDKGFQDCEFIKKRENTSLRVVYQGNYFLDCDNCCKRWFITFNGAECRGPMAIDAVLWIPSRKQPIHIPGYLEGYCENVRRGKIRVGINIGNCVGYGNSNGRTGWNSVSRLIIEEVPKPQ